MNFAHLLIFPMTSDTWKQFSPLDVQGHLREICVGVKSTSRACCVVIDSQWHNMQFFLKIETMNY